MQNNHEYPLDFLGGYRKIKFRIRDNATATKQLIIHGWEIETYPARTRVKAGDSLTDSGVGVYASIDDGPWETLEAHKNQYPLDRLGEFEKIKFRIRHNATATKQLIITGWEIDTYPIKVRRNL